MIHVDFDVYLFYISFILTEQEDALLLKNNLTQVVI